jgi:hypothetical protein
VLEVPIYIPSFLSAQPEVIRTHFYQRMVHNLHRVFSLDQRLLPMASGFPSHGASERHSSIKQP